MVTCVYQFGEKRQMPTEQQNSLLKNYEFTIYHICGRSYISDSRDSKASIPLFNIPSLEFTFSIFEGCMLITTTENMLNSQQRHIKKWLCTCDKIVLSMNNINSLKMLQECPLKYVMLVLKVINYLRTQKKSLFLRDKVSYLFWK